MDYSITRRSFLAGAGSFSILSSCRREKEQLPNIILLMGDDHGWDETGFYDHPYVKTPVLDEMSETGLRMDRFYSAAPVCSPTRGSVITGRHPNRYGTFTPNWSLRPEEIGIAQILKNAGYVCGHFGKWHLGPVKADSPTNPRAMGFDEYLSHDNFFEMNPWLSRNGKPPEEFKGESSDILVRETSEFIKKAKQENRPFFAVVWFGSPHEPYSGLEKDLALYKDLSGKYGDQTVRITGMETGMPADVPLDQVLQARFAEISAMDRAIGQLRVFLKEEEVRQNTLLWYCSDNGVPEHGKVTSALRGYKGDIYEGGIRVPSIIEWPERIQQNRITDLISVTSDILPTVCDLAGQPTPERPLDGLSLKELIDGDMTVRSKPICFWEYETGGEDEGNRPYISPELQEGTTPLVKMMDGRFTRNFRNFHHPEIVEEDFTGARAILDNQYKLVIEGEDSSPDKELFDLDSDQAEGNNLAENEPEVCQILQDQLRNWQESVLESLTGADY